MTYKSDFLPLDADMTVEYYGTPAAGDAVITFYTQDVDGGTSDSDYTAAQRVTTSGGRFQINDKFTGFKAYQYRVDGGAWQNVGAFNPSNGIYGEPVSYDSSLDIRYNRIKGAITFMDGAYVDGNGNPVDETP